MNRRHFFYLLWSALAVAFLRKKLRSEPLPAGEAWDSAEEMKQRRVKNDQYPIHECVDRPYLPCPACMKWTDDEFATAKINR